MNDKDLMKKLSTMTNDEIEQEANELINDGIPKELIKSIFKGVARKRQLMRLEKEMLVDMVFNLESRNETLVNNLLEVEKMYDKLKCNILDEAMDAMIEKEQNEGLFDIRELLELDRDKYTPKHPLGVKMVTKEEEEE